MTLEIGLVLGILVASIILFVSERIRMDLVALMVLASLVLLGLVTPDTAVSGFSNPAVVAVWSMFILSDGLTRTGIADYIGQGMLRLAGRGERNMILAIMLSAGFLSAFMSNIGVAALMLPVVVDIARRTRIAPGRLLMPLAYATLLGGLTTLIGTPPNLLISGAMTANGYAGFRLFDFTPVGLALLIVGTLVVAFVLRHLLPSDKPQTQHRFRSQRKLRSQYGLQSQNFRMKIPQSSILVGKSLAQSRIGSAAGLIVMALERAGKTELMPSRQTILKAGDQLFVQGRLDRFKEFRRWSELVIEREAPVLQGLMSGQVKLLEATVSEKSPLPGNLLSHSEFRRRYGANVLAVRRDEQIDRVNLTHVIIRPGDSLLLQASPETFEKLERSADFTGCREIGERELNEVYRLREHVFVVRVPRDSELAGDTLTRSRLGEAFDFRLLALFREGTLRLMPEPDEPLRGADLLLIQGREEDLDVLRGLQELQIDAEAQVTAGALDSERLALIEATLEPRSRLVGQLLVDLNFREKYGLELVALWRKGEAIRTNLDGLVVQLGDALLLLGPQDKLRLLENDQDFLLLTRLGPRPVEVSKAPMAGAIMLGVVAATLSGWLPIHIAAVVGCTLMVLSRCLSMEEAYRAIDWRAIFLIAGMLPLGAAMEDTGAARLIAETTMQLLGSLGIWWVIGGLYLITAIGTMVIPTAALVVLMSPIVLSASADLGINPATGMMALAMASSASFTSPISHPSNLLVMGPGGYRFSHFLKIGIPLTLIVFAATMILLPIFWPLTPAS